MYGLTNCHFTNQRQDRYQWHQRNLIAGQIAQKRHTPPSTRLFEAVRHANVYSPTWPSISTRHNVVPCTGFVKLSLRRCTCGFLLFFYTTSKRATGKHLSAPALLISRLPADYSLNNAVSSPKSHVAGRATSKAQNTWRYRRDSKLIKTWLVPPPTPDLFTQQWTKCVWAGGIGQTACSGLEQRSNSWVASRYRQQRECSKKMKGKKHTANTRRSVSQHAKFFSCNKCFRLVVGAFIVLWRERYIERNRHVAYMRVDDRTHWLCLLQPLWLCRWVWFEVLQPASSIAARLFISPLLRF